MDLLPTVAKQAGGDVPQDRIVDGKDLLPLLTNRTKDSSHEFTFHYCGDQIHAVITIQRTVALSGRHIF